MIINSLQKLGVFELSYFSKNIFSRRQASYCVTTSLYRRQYRPLKLCRMFALILKIRVRTLWMSSIIIFIFSHIFFNFAIPSFLSVDGIDFILSCLAIYQALGFNKCVSNCSVTPKKQLFSCIRSRTSYISMK